MHNAFREYSYLHHLLQSPTLCSMTIETYIITKDKLFWIIIVIAHLRDNIVLLKGKAKYILVILLLTIPVE